MKEPSDPLPIRKNTLDAKNSKLFAKIQINPLSNSTDGFGTGGNQEPRSFQHKPTITSSFNKNSLGGALVTPIDSSLASPYQKKPIETKDMHKKTPTVAKPILVPTLNLGGNPGKPNFLYQYIHFLYRYYKYKPDHDESHTCAVCNN